ncbi:hypothetical protein PoB_001185900 [Plakobranchus ocellatus]|uniref:Uncharacterized protein n=1 Tax=Plakobranchus ocellatus TaxID=259542 RepID=A0AAV3YTH3_9GAST|nr:hypothetical protein PoB_001185900 [Plakobranchus ocellatus]
MASSPSKVKRSPYKTPEALRKAMSRVLQLLWLRITMTTHTLFLGFKCGRAKASPIIKEMGSMEINCLAAIMCQGAFSIATDGSNGNANRVKKLRKRKKAESRRVLRRSTDVPPPEDQTRKRPRDMDDEERRAHNAEHRR